MEVLWFFNNQMLGIGNAPAYVPAPQGYGDGSETGLMTMLTDDMCQLDARVADHQFHINPPLLQVMRILIIQSCVSFMEKIVVAKLSAKVMNSIKVMRFIS